MKKSTYYELTIIVLVLFLLGYVVFSLTNTQRTSTDNPSSTDRTKQLLPESIDNKQLSASDAVWVKVTDPRLPVKAIWYPSFGLDSSYDIDDESEPDNLYNDEIAIFRFATQYAGSDQFDTHVSEMNISFRENKDNLNVQELQSSRYESEYEKNLWQEADAYEYVEYSNGLKGYMSKNKALPIELQEYLESEGFVPWTLGFEGVSPDGAYVVSLIPDVSGEGNMKKVTPKNEDINYFLHATLEKIEF